MCCGSRRSAWRSGIAATAPRSAGAEANVASSPAVETPDMTAPGPGVSRARLRYSGHAEIRVSGPITGRPYTFSREQSVQEVDVRDAAFLLRSARLLLSVLA